MLESYINKSNLFWEAVNTHEPQTWALEHTDVLENDFFIVKQFAKRGNRGSVLINPPMAGHHSNIAQTITKFYRENTNYNVFSIEWKPATPKTKDYGIEEIVNHIDLAVNHISPNQKIHLAGLCQGGWALAMWAALNNHRAKSLIIAGTPIDYVIDGGKCQMWLDMVSNQYIKNVIDYHDGIWPGKKQLLGFKLLNPVDRFLGTYTGLQKLVDEDDMSGIKKWVRNNSWYEYVQDLPGKMIREVCSILFRDNHLIEKKIVIDGDVVDLKNITCPVVAITGDDDDITLTRQCSEILNHVSSDKRRHFPIPDCGHIAIFLTKAAMERWGKAIEFVK